ncbi:uncharacterized protein TNCV_297831 [Trichonephila clavipes]|nr:uncharacterized protein TNCV_297831 [Trichonephila clavipes]
MQRDCALRIAGRGHLTSFSVEYKTGGVRASGSKRCHLHKDEAQNALENQSSRKTPHRKKCMRTANCFIGCHPVTGRTFIRGPCVFSNHTTGLAEGHLRSQYPLRVLHLKPPFGVVPRKRKLNCSGMEPGRL